MEITTSLNKNMPELVHRRTAERALKRGYKPLKYEASDKGDVLHQPTKPST